MQQPTHSHPSSRLSLPRACFLALLIAGFAGGCGSRNAASNAPSDPSSAPLQQSGDWFCQPAPPGAVDPWECVQDAQLAKNPKPDRLPDAKGPDSVFPAPPEQPPTTDSAPQEPQDLDSASPPAPPDADSAMLGPTKALPAEQQTKDPPAQRDKTPTQITEPPQPRSPTDSTPPLYAQLAYRPPTPVSMLALPSDFYAVQIAALNREQDLETFAKEHGLQGISAAKVLAQGKVHYVVILGIYETKALAARASKSLPPSLQSTTPWLRPMANLQQAMGRANEHTSNTPATN